MSEGIAGKSWRAAVPTRQEYRSNRSKSLPWTVSRVSRKFTEHQQRASLCSGERASAVYHKKSRNLAFIYVRNAEGELIMYSFASYFEKFFFETQNNDICDVVRCARASKNTAWPCWIERVPPHSRLVRGFPHPSQAIVRTRAACCRRHLFKESGLNFGSNSLLLSQNQSKNMKKASECFRTKKAPPSKKTIKKKKTEKVWAQNSNLPLLLLPSSPKPQTSLRFGRRGQGRMEEKAVTSLPDPKLVWLSGEAATLLLLPPPSLLPLLVKGEEAEEMGD